MEIRKAEPIILLGRRWLVGRVALFVVLQIITPSRAWIALILSPNRRRADHRTGGLADTWPVEPAAPSPVMVVG